MKQNTVQLEEQVISVQRRNEEKDTHSDEIFIKTLAQTLKNSGPASSVCRGFIPPYAWPFPSQSTTVFYHTHKLYN